MANPTVTINDPDQNDHSVVEIEPDEYLIVCGHDREITHANLHANGTVVVTIKHRAPTREE